MTIDELLSMIKEADMKFTYIKNRWSLITNNWSLHSGFTLIELLVVVAIIGILSALLMSNFIGVRQRARDAQRKSDMRQIQSALELFRADNGTYPSYGTTTLPCGTSSTIDADGIINASPPAGKAVYMQAIPCDPSKSTGYFYTSNGTNYSLISCLENSTDSQSDSARGAGNNSTYCDGSTVFSYTVTNP